MNQVNAANGGQPAAFPQLVMIQLPEINAVKLRFPKDPIGKRLIVLQWMNEDRLPIDVAMNWSSANQLATTPQETTRFRIHCRNRRKCYKAWLSVAGNTHASLTSRAKEQLALM